MSNCVTPTMEHVRRRLLFIEEGLKDAPKRKLSGRQKDTKIKQRKLSFSSSPESAQEVSKCLQLTLKISASPQPSSPEVSSTATTVPYCSPKSSPSK